ncbi:SDR family NAD(P)-dependent oxidoreductase [Novosphingobium mangrovi (ex Huang et al. 2023)]|uniref:SDR family NAD(P)-dependent oxidoreductase n=1 Tax=Novosphingobium mangrovi (ex Huang et al. 2023) TaxID=2976432 RepID=A0ABT2I2W2_9SPHN|nr:SDR family NAD(P)-dependent oxidoreductase [Novosphingobium mangrovi (ex Huang et al. 2023)]MCT2399136.1 SDR family NAD(P)-dependent oxidoreductase [Novosphingobium mangrovi (ex Huang et al. 2023)]
MDKAQFARRYGPWALIAGASEGTGASFARQLAEMGLNLILVARRQGPLDRLASELRGAHGVECGTASIDLSAENAAQQLLQVAGDREVGLLIFNAGADPNGSMFLDNAVANWDALAMRNVMTVMRALHAFGAPMRTRKRGGLMVVGSGACYGGLPGIGVYAATKAFDLVLCEALWSELEPHGVDVLSFVIGRTDTPAHRELMEARDMPIPEGLADPDDVARLGLERLPFGPICNWGEGDEEAIMSASSAAQRRERIRQIAAVSAAYAKKG